MPLVRNFWAELPVPFGVLAPMEDVTDSVFRRVLKIASSPEFFSFNETEVLSVLRSDDVDFGFQNKLDLIENHPSELLKVFFTEFTSCEGLSSPGRDKLIHRLKFHQQKERPIVAQVWGVTPQDYYLAAKSIVEMGFDGMDINMGCPVKKVIKQGACSALIKNSKLALKIVEAAKAGLENKIPLSIKTRIGFNEIDTENWIGFLLEKCRPDALTIHGRTVKQLSKVPNNWEEIGKASRIKDSISNCKTVLIGNGDILSYSQGVINSEKFNLQGFMVGRGVFSNPWFFNPKVRNNNGLFFLIPEKTLIPEWFRFLLLKIHLVLWLQTWGNQKNYQVLKKYFKIYLNGFKSAAALRQKFMEQTNNPSEALRLISQVVN